MIHVILGQGDKDVLQAAERHLEALPSGHPCQGCEVRDKAVCGVLDCAKLAQFKSLGRTLKLDSSQTLFHEGDPATRVFTLTSGTLKLYKLLPDGRRQVTGFMHPGDFLGMSMDDEHAFSAEALEAAILCWFPRNRFDDFVEEHGSMERELYRMAAHELAAARQQMVLLGRKTATERLASFLLFLAERSDRLPGRTPNLVRLPMSRSDIADYLGLTKETVSRVFSAFRRDRLIRLCATDEVEIIDSQGLEQLAECAA
jgi:CRP/FNR family transcriptional regulator, anaerobic regulatory protein